MSGVSKSQVSRLCEEIDERVNAFLDRPIEGDWPYLWIDATYVKVRQNGRIVSVAAIIAVGVNNDGRREMLGMDIGPSEAETFWTEFLRKLRRRGLRGVKLVVSDGRPRVLIRAMRTTTRDQGDGSLLPYGLTEITSEGSLGAWRQRRGSGDLQDACWRTLLRSGALRCSRLRRGSQVVTEPKGRLGGLTRSALNSACVTPMNCATVAIARNKTDVEPGTKQSEFLNGNFGCVYRKFDSA